MPGNSIRSSAVAILASICLIASCGPSMRVEHPISKRPIEVPDCEEFALRESVPFEIDVSPDTTRVDLGGGNWIDFASNAVDRPVRYRVRYLVRGPGPGKKAGIQIEQVGSAPMEFDEPVLLHLSYRACQGFPGGRKSMVRFPGNSGADFHWIGGAMSADSAYVEVFVNDFSGFAIAI